MKVKPTEDWPHKILVHLFRKYSAFNVHIDKFLKEEVLIGRSEDAGNLGRKIVRTLDELQSQHLITWEPTNDKGGDIKVNPDINDNTSVTLGVYQFHARLTFDGLVYTEKYLRLKGQDKIEKQNRNITIVGICIAALTGLFIGLTFKTSENSDKQFQNINKEFHKQGIAIDSMQVYQKSISQSMDSLVFYLPKKR
jgi:hypothetical protein